MIDLIKNMNLLYVLNAYYFILKFQWKINYYYLHCFNTFLINSFLIINI